MVHQLIGSLTILFTGDLYILGGAGFQPSTVVSKVFFAPWSKYMAITVPKRWVKKEIFKDFLFLPRSLGK